MTNVNELKNNEGALSVIRGKFLPADAMKRIPFRLQLIDSTILFIGSFDSSSNINYTKLDKYINQDVELRGTVYFESVPSQYKIISRLTGPYIVEIKEIKLVNE
jgi:hypothetical protein